MKSVESGLLQGGFCWVVSSSLVLFLVAHFDSSTKLNWACLVLFVKLKDLSVWWFRVQH